MFIKLLIPFVSVETNIKANNRVFHDKITFTFKPEFTARVFKKFSKSCLQWELNSQHWTPLDLKLTAYPNRPDRHVLFGRPLTESCFMHHFTFWACIISRIIKACLM